MANWSNAHLIIAGPSRRRTRISAVWPQRGLPPFLSRTCCVAKTQKLTSERSKAAWLGTFRRKLYRFQVRNGDGLQHFRRLSRRHLSLCFVLAYGDPNGDDYGSYFILKGRARAYSLSAQQKEAVMRRHGVTGDMTTRTMSGVFGKHHGNWSDLAEAHWQKSVLKAIVQR